MEKTTKKRKKAKGLKKRIGIIAVGGLSLVLTICLSVGATLAWFAGSTWSSNQMYMGGPVYVEMAGLGKAGGTAGSGDNATWQGGAGNLTIQAATQRTTGTHVADGGDIPDNILLPGQKFEIYSQARVFSTATTTSVGEDWTHSQTSGGNVTNTSNDGTKHITDNGRVTTTTSSILRARFSVSVEFDPTVGFNNFTDASYANNYPVQSGLYKGHYAIQDPATGAEEGDSVVKIYTPAQEDGDPSTEGNQPVAEVPALSWQSAMGAEEFKNTNPNLDIEDNDNPGAGATYKVGSRRDAVKNEDGYYTSATSKDTAVAAESTGLAAVRAGLKKSIYAWKFVSESVYNSAVNLTDEQHATVGTNGVTTTPTTDSKYARMPYPFNGEDTTYGENGYYGVWILSDAVQTDGEDTPTDKTDDTFKRTLTESNSFYKARCNAYIDSYVEEYMTEYNEIKTRTIGESLKALETSLNQSFVNLVNDSSDAIIAGNVFGMTKDTTNGKMTYAADPATGTANAYVEGSTNASWLYIDPKIGNDTNTDELSTSTGGWWYLVECDRGSVKTKANRVAITKDSAVWVPEVLDSDPVTAGNQTVAAHWSSETNTPTNAVNNFIKEGEDGVGSVPAVEGTHFFTRETTGYTSVDSNRLYAKLYEINPLTNLGENLGVNGTQNISKVVSYSFPFVNGTSPLPGDALTNVFANAKITIQISFQALQAFLPFSADIDHMDYTNPLLGTAKALNIANAIPIFNEAFDYQESFDASTVTGL